VERSRRTPFVNYGVQAFYAFTITYDETRGRITLASTS
jgi:hypothetical protein